jgi:hypothetical protein
MSSSSGAPYFAATGYQAGNYAFAQQPTQSQDPPKAESPKPPKKPLTPYMRFSKSVSIVCFLSYLKKEGFQ